MKTKPQPQWIDRAPEKGSYRSIFKWGAPEQFKHPGPGLLNELKIRLGLTDADFTLRENTGRNPVKASAPPALSMEHIQAFEALLSKDNVCVDDYSRVKYSHGKAMEDIYSLRNESPQHVTDCALHPRDKNDVKAVVGYCNTHSIPVQVFGGGSSVTLGLQSTRGGVTLVIGTHMNRVLAFNEKNQTITVEPGIMGPDYEHALNTAPNSFGASCPYTGGHFPQSFEFSSVGGWVVTLGSGQASSYYGDAYHLVISQEYVTPAGSFKTLDFPGTATGPKVNDIMKGSEGCFGVLVAVTMKVFKYRPENAKPFAFMLPSWEAAVNAARDISQGEFGMPSILRISDAEETDIGLKMKLNPKVMNLLERFLAFRGLEADKRCMLIGQADGEAGFAKNVKKNVVRICKAHGGMSITPYPMTMWKHGRYNDSYLREDLNDMGVMIDTLESSVTWDKIHVLHKGVRSYIKSHKNTICMTHASHFYPQGTNLYFIFLTPMPHEDEFRSFHRGIIDAIVQYGGSLSHHHGVGRMMGPYMERHLGKEQMAVLKALKKHFDPKGILNPGGTLGLE